VAVVHRAPDTDNLRVNQVLIIGSGEAPGREILQRWASTADRVIAANGGCATALAADIIPDLLIGDLDSLPSETRERIAASGTEVMAFPEGKDWTDLELAVEQAIRARPDRVLLAGVLRGRRLDHELSAVFLLERIVEEGIAGRILGLAETIELIEDRWESGDLEVGTTISLLPLSTAVSGVVTHGLRYALDGDTLSRASSRGLSNSIVARPAAVSIESGRLLIIIHLEASA
jgi:thiamine pyrophosphokinase